jgi:hypothetical protein
MGSPGYGAHMHVSSVFIAEDKRLKRAMYATCSSLVLRQLHSTHFSPLKITSKLINYYHHYLR